MALCFAIVMTSCDMVSRKLTSRRWVYSPFLCDVKFERLRIYSHKMAVSSSETVNLSARYFKVSIWNCTSDFVRVVGLIRGSIAAMFLLHVTVPGSGGLLLDLARASQPPVTCDATCIAGAEIRFEDSFVISRRVHFDCKQVVWKPAQKLKHCDCSWVT